MVSYWERRRQDHQRRELAKRVGVAPSQLSQSRAQAEARVAQPNADERAQVRLREEFPADPLFGQSGTGRVRSYTPEEQAANRRALEEFVFGPERPSVVNVGRPASRPERLVRDWFLSEQEFRTAGERAREGELLPAVGWAGLGLAGVVPVAGDAAQALARGGRAAEAAADVARAAGAAADVARGAENRWADAWRVSRAGQDWRAPDISEGVAQEILNESMQFTLPQERLASIPEQRRPTAEVFHRQQFDAEPQRIEGKFFYPAVDSSGGTPIYRGLSAASEDEAAQYAQQFLSGEYHIGVGFNGRGSYFGTDPRTALEYASMMSRDFPQGRPGAIVRAIVPPKARIFDDSLDSALTRSIMRSFSASNFDDLGMYLAALGYDGQRVKRLGEEYIVMYNRGILKADESVYKVPAGLKRQKDEGGWEGMSQILRNLYGEDFVR